MAAIKFSIAIDQETLSKISEIAEKEDRKRNYIINKAIKEYIKKYEKEGN